MLIQSTFSHSCIDNTGSRTTYDMLNKYVVVFPLEFPWVHNTATLFQNTLVTCWFGWVNNIDWSGIEKDHGQSRILYKLNYSPFLWRHGKKNKVENIFKNIHVCSGDKLQVYKIWYLRNWNEMRAKADLISIRPLHWHCFYKLCFLKSIFFCLIKRNYYFIHCPSQHGDKT